jgi:hypothetical protein
MRLQSDTVTVPARYDQFDFGEVKTGFQVTRAKADPA